MANLSNINNKFLVTTTGEVLIGQTSNNGNRLQITGADGASYIYLKTDVATTGGRIGFNGDALRVFNQQASGELNLGTAGTTRLTIDSSGNVGINNTNPSAFNSLGGLQTVIGNGSGNANLTLYGASTDYSHVAFADSNSSGSSAQYAGLLQYYHVDNSLRIYTNGIERIKINDAGNVFISTPITNAFYGLSLTYNNTNTADFTVNQATGQIKIGGTAAGYFPTFYSGGSEKMRITSGGQVQVGYYNTARGGANTTFMTGKSGTTYLELNGGDVNGEGGLLFADGSGGNYGLINYSHVSDIMQFYTASTERMRIDSVGLATFRSTYIIPGFYGGEVTLGGSDTTFGLQLKYNQDAATTSTIYHSPGYNNTNNLFKLGAGSGNTNQLVLKGNGNVGIGTTVPVGKLTVANPTADDIIDYTKGIVFVDTTAGNENDPWVHAGIVTMGSTGYDGNLIFATDGTGSRSSNTSGLTERMRITKEGEIHIKNGTTTGGKILLSGTDNDLQIDGSRGQIIYSINGTHKCVMDSLQFYPAADNGLNLGTSFLRFSTVYATNGVNTSDETLKENIKECYLGIDFIDSLKPKSYNLKDLKEDNDAYGKKRYGLIAQDILETELKDSVFGKKDGEYGLSYNDLIAPMIKAIQELKAEIELLKSK